MNIGLIGLGKMGFNLSMNLLDHQHEVTAFDVNEQAVKDIAEKGAAGAHTIQELVEKLPTPRVVWVMVPAGKVTESVLEELKGL